MRQSIMQEMIERKIVAIVRGVPAKCMPKVAEALLAGGVSMLEITFDHAGKDGIAETLRSLAILKEKMGDRIRLGAGTVLAAAEVVEASRQGAEYIISPNVDESVIAKTKELGLLSMPGALTPSEVAAAHKMGGDIVKVFPAGTWGVEYIKAIRGPLGHIPMAAVGGVAPDNIASFFGAGVCCAGIGNNLVNAKKVADGDFHSITRVAKALSSSCSCLTPPSA